MKPFQQLIEALSKNIAIFSRDVDVSSIPEEANKLIVVFEFECYLDAGKMSLYNELDGDYLDLKYVESDWESIINNYFEHDRAYHQLNKDYNEWYKKKSPKVLKKKINEILDSMDMPATIERYGYAEWDELSDIDKYEAEKLYRTDNQWKLVDAWIKDNTEMIMEKIKTEIQESLENNSNLNNDLELDMDDYLNNRFNGGLEKIVSYYGLEPTYGWHPRYGDTIWTDEPTLSMIPGSDEYQIAKYEQLYPNIKEVISDHFSTTFVRHSAHYHSGYKDKKYWHIEPDGSLSNDGPYGDESLTPMEIVSPWTSGDKAVNLLESFKELFHSLGGVTDESTGGHINIRFDLPTEIDWFKLLLITNDSEDLYKFDRRTSHYAIESHKNFYERLQAFIREYPNQLNSSNIEEFIETIKPIYKEHIAKYDAINLKKFFSDREGHEQGFIEFRIAGDDYLGEKFKHTKAALIKYMNLMLALAKDSDAFKSEYHTKVYKIYQNIINHPEKNMFSLEKLESVNNWKVTKLYIIVIPLLARKYNLHKTLNELIHYLKQISLESTSIILPLYLNNKDIRNLHLSLLLYKNANIKYNLWVLLLMYLMGKQPSLPPSVAIKIKTIINSFKEKYPDVFNETSLGSHWQMFNQHFPKVDARKYRGVFFSNAPNPIGRELIEHGGVVAGEIDEYYYIILNQSFYVSWYSDESSMSVIENGDDGYINCQNILREKDKHAGIFEAVLEGIASNKNFNDWYLGSVKEMTIIASNNHLLPSQYRLNDNSKYWTSNHQLRTASTVSIVGVDSDHNIKIDNLQKVSFALVRPIRMIRKKDVI